MEDFCNTIIEVDGDLFSVDKRYSMAHCVAADLRMGKGIAIKFRDRFGQIGKLKQQNIASGGVAVLKDGERFIYYLVTKNSSWQKPTYQSLSSALEQMRSHMHANGITKLAIPRIGCGLDGLDWSKVKDQLHEIFAGANAEILVYNYKK